ncbi:hypothetical protein B0T09DRAFT_356211 [Sordaria sp. MPI-SDFR-AT-0083]|nr:hypothetical protein B0T09DRAFT_356211 [Sordaria sp. MPI-SDFR-AT-0083]
MSSSLPLKTRISPPLGAGSSLAEGGDHLPGNLTSALEYASKRLQRKGAKFTLLVIRKDYQLPTSPLGSPSAQSFSCGSTPSSSTSSSVASTPAKPTFAHAFKQFVRGDTGPIKERVININTDYRYGATSPTFSEASLTSASTASTVDSVFTNHRGRVGGAGRWPLSPGASQAPSAPLTPATPYSTSSMAADNINTTCLPSAGLHATRGFGPALLQIPSSPTSSDFGIRLIHAIPLKEKEDKLLSSTLEKAAKKFNISPSSLPPPIPASTLGLPPELLHRSLAQNEVLFGPSSSSSGAAGLRLLSLDHLYTFRSALQCYTRTVNHKPSVSRSIAHRRLEDAVDELRRLVLGNGCQKLKKSCLVSAYARFMDPVSNRSLEEVGRMYGRAYGRREHRGGRDVREKGWVDDTVDKVEGVEQGIFELMGDFEMPEPVRVMKEKPLPVAPVSNGWVGPYYYGGDEKAVVVAEEDIDLDEMADMMDEIDLESKLEMDDIEAWYRNVQIGVGQIGVGREVRMVNVNRAQQYRQVQPSRLVAPIPTVDINIDGDNDDRTPTREVERVVIHEMQELHRTTPRLSPAPPGRSPRSNVLAGLKLQTTFDPKPPKSSNRKRSPRHHLAPRSPARQSDLELTTPIRVQRTLAKMELELVIPSNKPKRGGFIYNSCSPLASKSPQSQTSSPSTVQGAQSPSSDFDSPSTVIINSNSNPTTTTTTTTTTQSPSSDSPLSSSSSSSSEEEEQHTARPLDSPRTALTATRINIWLQPPHSSGNTLDGILHNGNSSSSSSSSSNNLGSQNSDVENESEDSDNERLEVSPGGGRYNRFGNRLGPLTPNGYDDISPITRGEWGFLMGVGGAGGVGGLARRAGVEAL